METTTTTTTTATLPLPRTHTRSHPPSRGPHTSSTPTSSRSARRRGDPAARSPSQHHTPQISIPLKDSGYPPSLHEAVAHSSGNRSRSPDVQSRVSGTSSVVTGGPHLRKKPKSISIQNKPRSKSSGVVGTPTVVSSTHSEHEDYAPVFSPPLNPVASSNLPTRTDLNLSQQQSPFYKRPPASHSSYGVETTCGPPPTYTTQRTFSQERIKKPDRNTILWIPSQDKSSISAEESSSGEQSSPPKPRAPDDFVRQSPPSPETTRTKSIPTPQESDPMANVTLRGHQHYRGESTEDDSKGSSSDERKSEDLFLNIAKVDAARAPASRADRRRSRISIPFLSSGRSNHETKSSPINNQYETEQRPSHVEEPRYYSKRSSIGSHMPGVLSRNYMGDGGRVKDPNTDLTPDTEVPEYELGRRHSNANTEHPKLSQRPSQGLRGQRSVAESNYTNPSRIGEHIATESTVSTTAPSTVWDELDDLKSRIRKLELTGKLPPSSAAAMSSAERPRTATTVATTMSASPKLKTGGMSLPSAVDGIPSNIHPLLHEALGNAKQTLSHDVYSKLYATASDALQLATMMSSEVQSTSQAINANHDRQIRRRTENMCRGITELAIALTAESKGSSMPNRPTSREQSNPPNTMLRSRRYSNDPGDRGVPSRVGSRLDSRRTSLVMSASSPMVGGADPALPPLPGLRLGRSSTITRSRRGPGAFDGVDDEVEASPSIRPISRAMTDLGAFRRASRDPVENSRDFTSQHPMPRLEVGTVTTPLSSHASSNFMSRRKYTSPATMQGTMYENSPVTPHDALSPRDGWGKISTIAGDATPSEVTSELGRGGAGRRSLGFASRIGSSVGNRLRAVRNDRGGRDSFGEAGTPRDVSASQRYNESIYPS